MSDNDVKLNNIVNITFETISEPELNNLKKTFIEYINGGDGSQGAIDLISNAKTVDEAVTAYLDYTLPEKSNTVLMSWWYSPLETLICAVDDAMASLYGATTGVAWWDRKECDKCTTLEEIFSIYRKSLNKWIKLFQIENKNEVMGTERLSEMDMDALKVSLISYLEDLKKNTARVKRSIEEVKISDSPQAAAYRFIDGDGVDACQPSPEIGATLLEIRSLVSELVEQGRSNITSRPRHTRSYGYVPQQENPGYGGQPTLYQQPTYQPPGQRPLYTINNLLSDLKNILHMAEPAYPAGSNLSAIRTSVLAIINNINNRENTFPL